MASRYRDCRVRLVDLCALTYMGGVALLYLVFGRGSPENLGNAALHLLYVAGGLELIRASQRHPQSYALFLARTFYPAAVILFGFLEMGHLQRMVSTEYWATDVLIDADLALFGTHPGLWFQKRYAPVLDEVMAFFHLAYYLIPAAVIGVLLKQDRRSALWASASIVLVTYCANYLLFLLIPAVSPRMTPELAMAEGPEFSGYVFGAIERFIQGDEGTVRGAVFPSAHVSGAMAWALAALRYERRLGYALLLTSFGTAASTAYLGFHHAVDPLAGVVLALVMYPIALRWLRQRREDPRIDPEGAAREYDEEGARLAPGQSDALDPSTAEARFRSRLPEREGE